MSESPTNGIASVEAEQGGAAPPPRNMVTEDTANAIAPGVASATPAIPISESCDPATALCHVAWKGISPCSSVSEGDKLKVMWKILYVR